MKKVKGKTEQQNLDIPIQKALYESCRYGTWQKKKEGMCGGTNRGLNKLIGVGGSGTDGE